MPSPFDPFFPAGPETWTFQERGSGLDIPISYTSAKEGDRTHIALDLPPLPAYFNAAFFDRMTLTPAGLELNRIRLNAGVTVPISPPLVVTLDPHEANAVEVLFPPARSPSSTTSRRSGRKSRIKRPPTWGAGGTSSSGRSSARPGSARKCSASSGCSSRRAAG